MAPSKKILLAEFIIICIGVPACMIFFRLAPIVLLALWIATLVCIVSYHYTPGTKGEPIWRFNEVNWKNLRPILLRFILSSSLLGALVYIFMPEKLFSFVSERPEIWWRVMVFYPIFSAIPQEFIFCTWFFTRFKYLFTNEKHLLTAATIIFGCTHILYINWVAPTLCLFAGYFFAQTYMKTRSLALVSLEHALYGNMIFTLGLGTYFFGGRVPQQTTELIRVFLG